MDYTTLVGDKTVAGSVANWMNNSLIQSMAPIFIQEAESMIFRRLRAWQMLSTPTSGTFTAGTPTIAVPTDFLEPYMLYLTANSQIVGYGPMVISLATPEMVLSRYGYDSTGSRIQSTPTMYYFDGSNLNFDVSPDQAYPYSLIYYQQPAALSNSNTTNFLTKTYPRMLRAAILAQACEWSKESATGQYDRTYWLQVAQAEIDMAQEESDFAKRAISNSTGMVEAGTSGLLGIMGF